MGIIYCVENKTNGKKYIGQSIKSLEERKIKHLNSAFKHNSLNRFHQALRKYSENNFVWSILENIKEIDLDKREIFNIDKFDTFNSGYNMTEGGHDLRGYKHSDKTKLKIGKALKGRSNKDHYIASYGEIEGDKRYDEYISNMKDRKGKSRLEGFIEKYGKKEGNERYNKFVEKLKKAHAGKILSEEHKKKIGISGTGRKMSESMKEKLRNRIYTEEHLKNMRISQRIRREREKISKQKKELN